MVRLSSLRHLSSHASHHRSSSLRRSTAHDYHPRVRLLTEPEFARLACNAVVDMSVSKPRLHDTTGCQTGCETALKTG